MSIKFCLVLFVTNFSALSFGDTYTNAFESLVGNSSTRSWAGSIPLKSKKLSIIVFINQLIVGML